MVSGTQYEIATHYLPVSQILRHQDTGISFICGPWTQSRARSRVPNITFRLGHHIRCESTTYKRSKGVSLITASEKTLRPFLTASVESDKDPGNAAIKPGKWGFVWILGVVRSILNYCDPVSMTRWLERSNRKIRWNSVCRFSSGSS